MTFSPQVLLVTGGYDEHINYLDTTEVLRPGSGWQEISSAKLPRPMYGVRLSTVDNRVFLFGELNRNTICHHYPLCVAGGGGGDVHFYDEILELSENESWIKVGEMKKARVNFGLSPIVNFKMFETICNILL